MNSKVFLSIVAPCFNEAINLVEVSANPPRARDAALQPVVERMAALLRRLELRDL